MIEEEWLGDSMVRESPRQRNPREDVTTRVSTCE
jgi:hypothetical protein